MRSEYQWKKIKKYVSHRADVFIKYVQIIFLLETATCKMFEASS